MSRHRKHKKLENMERDGFGSIPKSSLAGSIENWILYGDERGKEAVQTLFHVRYCPCQMCVTPTHV